MAEEKKKKDKKEESGATSDVIEKATGWAWIIGFALTILLTAYMGLTDNPFTWIPVLGLIAEIVGGIWFALSPEEATGIKQGLAVLFFGIFILSGVSALNSLCNAIYQVGTMSKNWLDFSMSMQPDMREKVVTGSLVLEMVLPVVVGVVGYLVLYYWLSWTDKKFAVAIAFLLYALTRGQLEVFLVAVLLGMGVIRVIKKLVKGAAKDTVEKAKEKGQWNFAIGFGAVSTIVIGLFLAQGTTWVTGLLVIFSEHPFTTLAFIAQGTLVGGGFALKV